jgi:hypothetical protein
MNADMQPNRYFTDNFIKKYGSDITPWCQSYRVVTLLPKGKAYNYFRFARCVILSEVEPEQVRGVRRGL